MKIYLFLNLWPLRKKKRGEIYQSLQGIIVLIKFNFLAYRKIVINFIAKVNDADKLIKY